MKKISSPMLEALIVARVFGTVQQGDPWSVRIGTVGMSTLVALRDRKMIRCTRDGKRFELTQDGYRALAEAGIITADQYAQEVQDQRDALAEAHAEALALDEKRTIVRAALSVPTGVVIEWGMIEQAFEAYQNELSEVAEVHAEALTACEHGTAPNHHCQGCSDASPRYAAQVDKVREIRARLLASKTEQRAYPHGQHFTTARGEHFCSVLTENGTHEGPCVELIEGHKPVENLIWQAMNVDMILPASDTVRCAKNWKTPAGRFTCDVQVAVDTEHEGPCYDFVRRTWRPVTR